MERKSHTLNFKVDGFTFELLRDAAAKGRESVAGFVRRTSLAAAHLAVGKAAVNLKVRRHNDPDTPDAGEHPVSEPVITPPGWGREWWESLSTSQKFDAMEAANPHIKRIH